MRLEEISEGKISELDKFLSLDSNIIAYTAGLSFLYIELLQPVIQNYFR